MPKISPVDWKLFEKFLLYIGCEFDRQKGSHRVYKKDGLKRPIIIPVHQKQKLPVFIIKNSLRLLDIDNETYIQILKQI